MTIIIYVKASKAIETLVSALFLRHIVLTLNFLFILSNCFLKNNWFIYDFTLTDTIDDTKLIYYMGLENRSVELFDFHTVNAIRDTYTEILKPMQSLADMVKSLRKRAQ